MRSARFGLLILSALTGAAAVQAQTRFRIDPRSSLAWWQVNPHLNHLWATTCPEEPSWKPGEGRSSGWVIGKGFTPPKHGYGGVYDTTIVPLYPRQRASSVCSDAIEGHLLVADTAQWHGVRGEVTVRGEALITGEDRRDAYTHQAILQTDRYPEIRFTIDSVIDVTRQADTIRATAIGVFYLHGVRKPTRVIIRGWPELGGLRVVGKFSVPALSLTEEFGLSRFALGLGVTTRIWYDLFMGIDLVLRPQAGAGN